MQRLIDYLEERAPGMVEAQAYVDTGPPVDREVAEKAGLGWFGKNACLYVPGFGSWVFLGEIFTNLELAPDPRITLDCGDCDRCIRACPTGAIVEPYYVDPFRCISQLTQMSEPVPLELRARMGLRYGAAPSASQYGPGTARPACPAGPGL